MNSVCPSCGKNRDFMNNTNWTRHKESCKKKIKSVKRTASSSISNFFKPTDREGKLPKFEQSGK